MVAGGRFRTNLIGRSRRKYGCASLNGNVRACSVSGEQAPVPVFLMAERLLQPGGVISLAQCRSHLFLQGVPLGFFGPHPALAGVTTNDPISRLRTSSAATVIFRIIPPPPHDAFKERECVRRTKLCFLHPTEDSPGIVWCSGKPCPVETFPRFVHHHRCGSAGEHHRDRAAKKRRRDAASIRIPARSHVVAGAGFISAPTLEALLA